MYTVPKRNEFYKNIYEVLTHREDGRGTYTREKVRTGSVGLFNSDSCVRLT